MSKAVKAALQNDPRAGAQALLSALEKRKQDRAREQRRVRRMLTRERHHLNQGVAWIAGVDEAGMSPLAGPIVAGAVVLHPKQRLLEVNDSKQLSEARREALFEVVCREARAFGVGRVEPEELLEHNVYQAGLLAMRRAVADLSLDPEVLLVDARTVPGFSGPQESIIKGDQKSLSIAAASIVAKVTRDRTMRAYALRYPEYGFEQHKGYGVAAHVRAIEAHGPCPIHRMGFAPVIAAQAVFERRGAA